MIVDIFLQTKLFVVKILAILFGKHRRLNRLGRSARYTPGTYAWKNTKLEFPDARSFVYVYKELFIEQIYKFHTEKEQPFIIDCGANVGLGVIFFKEQYPRSRVIAFEPERTIFSYLKKNVENLQLEGVELINKAVWSRNELLLFNNEGADASRLAAFENKDGGFSSSYEVEAVRLSEFIDQEVDLLKIDIEGAELEVIREIEPKLRRVRHIFIEYHSLEGASQELDTLLNILSRNNFRYYIDTPDRMRQRPFIDKDIFMSFDVFLNIYAIRQA